MDLRYLLKDMVWKLCLIALKEMKKTELSIIDYDGFTDLEELIAFIKNAPDLLVR